MKFRSSGSAGSTRPRSRILSLNSAPSGHFQVNAAWLALAALAHNLTRAAGALASAFHAKATTATIRDHLINVPARTLAPG